MATEREIRAHQKRLDDEIRDFELLVNDLLGAAFDEIAALGTAATRTDVVRIFDELRRTVEQRGARLDSIIQSNIEMNSAVLGTATDSRTLQNIQEAKAQLIAEVEEQIAQEQNRVIETIVLAGIAGAVATDLVRQTRSIESRSRSRLTTLFGAKLYQLDALVTRARSPKDTEQRYQYVGGIIETSREFCQRHDGAIYTEQEIRDIWNDSWPGQAPGDPFVVRGGYNCRHTWVAVEE